MACGKNNKLIFFYVSNSVFYNHIVSLVIMASKTLFYIQALQGQERDQKLFVFVFCFLASPGSAQEWSLGIAPSSNLRELYGMLGVSMHACTANVHPLCYGSSPKTRNSGSVLRYNCIDMCNIVNGKIRNTE